MNSTFRQLRLSEFFAPDRGTPPLQSIATTGSRGKRKLSNEEILARWSEPGAAGFYAWLADVKPRIKHADKRFREYTPIDLDREHYDEALKAGPDGKPVYTMHLERTPRRHAKSTRNMLKVLWLACIKKNINIDLIGNGEEHALRYMLSPLAEIIRHTPALHAIFGGEESLRRMEIVNASRNNWIRIFKPTARQIFGGEASILWISDYHQAPDVEAIQARFAALADSEWRLILIDANPDYEGGPVSQLEAGIDDPGFYFRPIEYRDFEHFKREAPPWIDREEVARQKKFLFESSFRRDWLGKRADASNSFFPAKVIESIKDKPHTAPISPEALKEIVAGRSYVVGAGLDRARSFASGFRTNVDNSVLTVTAKIGQPGGEPIYYVLLERVFSLNTDKEIIKAILQAHETYKLDNVCLEDMETASLEPKILNQGINCELVNPNVSNQNRSFPELYRAAQEGRLHAPANLEGLFGEMRTFIYRQIGNDGNKFSFGHASQKFRDDRIYALNWSMWATRKRVLAAFRLGNIQCSNLNATKRRLCFLMGGEAELMCREQCLAYHEVQRMHREYQRLQLDEELSLPAFMAAHVKRTGATVYQGV